MKKMLLLAAVAALSVPVFAGDKNEVEENGPRHFGPRHEMMQKNPEFEAEMQAKKAEFQAQREKMKATEEKMENLVKEYKKAKIGSKKQIAARNEIADILGNIRDEQIAKREEQINGFEKRLADMKNRLAEEKTPEMKQEWVTNMMNHVFEKDGNLQAVFQEYGPMGKKPKGPRGFGGKGHFKGGFKGGPKPSPDADILPMPPAPVEEK